VLDWVQNRDPKFEHQKNDLNWKTWHSTEG
jgi:hypothetical protein